MSDSGNNSNNNNNNTNNGSNVQHLQGVPPGTQEAEGLPIPDRRVGEECLTNRDGAAAILVVLRLQTEDVFSLATLPEGKAV